MNKTEGVRQLVEQVLNCFTSPPDEDLIEHVCMAIEANPQWSAQYHRLAEELGAQTTVNSWIGRYVKDLSGFNSGRSHPSKSHLIKSYRKLIIPEQQ
ncbi:hypothetical protein [Sodalinema gerasimenkoae]|uniref:hypothetical protein n=1 Tax=Sodalinema gerasimenkoae TaxID=2862348 RepID=UPI00135AE66C|nr:hypothetical protein [Sodalinema gerasimenkoae]